MINPLSYCILFLLLFVILSMNFFPIKGLEIVYKYRIVLIVLYIVLRIVKHFVFNKKQSTDE